MHPDATHLRQLCLPYEQCCIGIRHINQLVDAAAFAVDMFMPEDVHTQTPHKLISAAALTHGRDRLTEWCALLWKQR